jgi:hypothetical protein
MVLAALRVRLAALIVLNALLSSLAQADGAIPGGVILVKGAWSSATVSAAPLPEGGASSQQTYRNPYFNLNYVFGTEWSQSFEGPPPSESGYYVLAQLEPATGSGGSNSGHVMIAAQDLFFTASPAGNAFELLEYYQKNLDADYTVEQAPTRVRIANHEFVRLDYTSALAGLHWHVLATQIRCHVVQFVFTGRGGTQRFLESVKTLQLADGQAPVCIKDFATAENVLQREEPVYSAPRFNPVPVRIIVDTEGKVKHIHFLSAFPEQAKSISDALSLWRFRPFKLNGQVVEVETGITFGRAARRPVSALQ